LQLLELGFFTSPGTSLQLTHAVWISLQPSPLRFADAIGILKSAALSVLATFLAFFFEMGSIVAALVLADPFTIILTPTTLLRSFLGRDHGELV